MPGKLQNTAQTHLLQKTRVIEEKPPGDDPGGRRIGAGSGQGRLSRPFC